MAKKKEPKEPKEHKECIDVRDSRCFERSCYMLGLDKGTFTQGRGYTSYHAKARAVCMTRYLRGCPTVAVCPLCRTCLVENDEHPEEYCKLRRKD